MNIKEEIALIRNMFARCAISQANGGNNYSPTIREVLQINDNTIRIVTGANRQYEVTIKKKRERRTCRA